MRFTSDSWEIHEVRILVFIAFAIVLGNMAWRYFRSGSLTGAILGGKITREIGEVALASGAVSKALKVQTMESSADGTFISLILVEKTAFGANLTPVKLSKPQTQELITLLRDAMQ